MLVMPGHLPALDDHSLARLRRYVLALRRRTGGSLPMEQLVGLARDVRTPAGVTIDLRATEQLGAPLVVVRIAEAARTAVVLDGLSNRESQVCALIAEGRSNKQIACRLLITLATVKDHVHNILTKTGAPNRAAIAAAYREASTAQAGSSNGEV
jgi:DNA-binding CsgD family transcriptional regulator